MSPDSSRRPHCDDQAAWLLAELTSQSGVPWSDPAPQGKGRGGRLWGVQGPPSVLPLTMPLVTKILVLSPGSELGHEPALGLTPQTLL